jgi:[acyl-carrier-protein] S-malonyltransferase
LSGIAILCSGQGGQNGGMFDLCAEAPGAQAIFAAAASVLGADPRDIVHRAEDDALHTNRLGQILCCTQALAVHATIGDLIPPPVVVAGYSVGELAAWGVAGVFDPGTVLRLAEQRATTMDEATHEPSGLLAIRGLSRGQVEALCQDQDAYVAIVNAADRLIVGGTNMALAQIAEQAVARGAQRTTRLPVAIASHTPMLDVASAAFARTLGEAPRSARIPNGVRLLSGIDGTPVFNLGAGLDKLARQMAQTVDWAACMDACLASNVDIALELGPGHALASMTQDRMPTLRVRGADEFRSLDGLRRWLGTGGS